MAGEIYRIPNRVQKGSSVAVWGAGRVGESIYKDNLERKYCDIVLWVDMNWNDLSNTLVCSPKKLDEVSVDYVIIAIDAYSRDIADKIRKELREHNFSDNQIVGPIWKTNHYFEKERQIYKSTSRKEINATLSEWKSENDVPSKYSDELIYLILKGAFNTDNQGIELQPDTKHFFVTGAGFHNSGAEAMLYTVADNIRSRYPNAFIWFFPADRSIDYTEELQRRYKFCFWLDTWDEDALTWDLMGLITAIIDVSGYALYSGVDTSWYRKILEVAKEYSIPLFLMPQSYGPFDKKDYEDNDLRSLLLNAKIVYARESAGYRALTEGFSLNNVVLADDIVLTAKPSEYSFIKKDFDEVIRIPQNSVAVVPNSRLFEKAEGDFIYKIYRGICSILMRHGKNIYIINHAGDEEFCKKLYELYSENKQVHLLEKRVDAVEFPMYAEQFDYMVVSRYHAIVQAYKKNVPCLVIGWADKYLELMAKAGQEQYCFDVRTMNGNDELESALRKLDDNYCKESEIISEKLRFLESKCFGFLDNLMA